MPGDELVTRPTFNATRAVTVAAPPSVIWPWIVQIGFGRAGWYSYDLLDNLGRPSATMSTGMTEPSRRPRRRSPRIGEPRDQPADAGPAACRRALGRARGSPLSGQ